MSGVACLEHGLTIRNTRGRGRDAAGRPVADRMVMDVHDGSETDASFSDDAMEVEVEEQAMANPNDF